jgi:dTDP-4-dehydrorhamnose 3,5-epimerase
MVNNELPEGVIFRPLKVFDDMRGWLLEIYRDQWHTVVQPEQWTVTFSGKNSLRGMHVHLQRQDYLVLLSGEMQLALRDMRQQSPTFETEVSVKLTAAEPVVWMIPNGVAHGFYCPADSMYIVGLSHSWNPEDDLAFRWDDPDFGIAFPAPDAVMSDRDRNAPMLRETQAKLSSKFDACQAPDTVLSGPIFKEE